ncbi:hypothetical protein PPROV_000651200 [Pycnococcus provasolii]|uniref:Calmodulin-lysine N-methyltransferase n=1 Tax=Pycnococcus provasolii TaxID=41880 RepID=A0A830HPQ6_9CHLO|nr:hypothetical protein PPROV_000651200 [Pycnococcus provasolii]
MELDLWSDGAPSLGFQMTHSQQECTVRVASVEFALSQTPQRAGPTGLGGLGAGLGGGVARLGGGDDEVGDVDGHDVDVDGGDSNSSRSSPRILLDMTRVLWPSSLPLADFIMEQALHNQGDEMCRIPLLARAAAKRRLNQPTGIRALELGAGCAGLPGMALAALVADEVTLTDVASALPLLEENVRRFTDAAAASGNTRCGKIDVRAFDWLDGEHIADMASDLGYDVVVGTDIAYADSLLEPLVRATMAVLKPGGVLLLSENLRSRRMHHEARAAFGKPGYFAVTVPQVGTFADHLEEEAALLVGTWQCESEARAMRRKLAVCKK